MLHEAHTLRPGRNLYGNANRCFASLIFLVCGFCLTFCSPALVQGRDWPTWRYDAARSAACPEELPAELHLQWVRQLAPPRPAWPASQDRLQFDASYEPVVAGKTLFVGSMVCDSVTAYDTQTGAEKWRFYTDGPVRFAPVVYKDKLYVASDDGCLYCLNADTGDLVHKLRGGPAGNKVIGNGRLISTWPARGGPVLYDGTIYFAASIWPFMGTFIHAVDAESGRILWSNSGSGSTYLMQPHSSPAFAGVAPQGYLVATDDKLLISGGRSVPAAYDRRTGQFLYYHLNQYGKIGTCEVMACDRYFFNCGAVHALSDGYEIVKARASVAADDCFIGGDDDTITAYRLEPGKKAAKTLWRAKLPFEIDRIHLKAGSRLYCSSEDRDGTILAVDIPIGNEAQAEVSWRAKVDGKVWSMLAADEKLFVVTLEGGLYCFAGQKTEPQRHRRQTESLPAGSRRRSNAVRQLLETTGKREGYCLLLGLGTGEFLNELVNQSGLHVIALDPNAEKVAAVRRKLDEASLYGIRAAAHVGDVTAMLLPPYMADLIVTEDLDAAGFNRGDVFIERVFHSLRPYGGTACFSVPRKKHAAILKRVSELNLPGCTTAGSGRWVTLTRAGALPGSADWTHQYADSANTVMSRDKRVKAPLGLLWFGGPSNDKVLPRHGHGPSPQVVGGRLFIEGRNMLRAVDVYTGRLMWEREFQDLGAFYDNTDHQPGANEIGSNYVTVSDAVYVVYGDTIHVLDPATGATTKEFSMPGEDRPRWGTLLVWEDLLLATASPLHVPLKDSHGRGQLPANMRPIIDQGADWQYLAGAHPNDAWTSVEFDAEAWKTSAAGFGSDGGKTVLKDMQGRYSVVYIRKSFNVPEPQSIPELGLVANYKDGFIAYLNGQEVLRVGVTSGRGAKASGVGRRKSKGWEYFKIDNPDHFLREGTNILAIEGHNEKVTNAGFILDPYLVVLPEAGNGEKKAQFADLTSISGVRVNADYASGSKVLLALDRHSGTVLWKRDAKYSFRHNAIVAAAGKVFCIDGMSEDTLATFRRRGIIPVQERTLYALDARTGEVLWKTSEDVFGTWLAYAAEYDILLEAGSRSGDRATDEADRRMAAYRGSDGKVFWRNDDSYKGPPLLYHEWVITQTDGGSGSAAAEAKAFDLLTGKTVTREHPMTGQTIPWTWVRFKGCNTAIASENLLTFRSASGAFVDLTAGQGTASIGGFKSGCTSNLIIADGVLNAPDYTRTCVCSYQNQASLALVHSPEVAYWTFDYYPSPSEPTPVKQVGINFGAPGNRYSPRFHADKPAPAEAGGTLWLEFPSVGGPSPDVPVRAEYENPRWFRQDSSLVEGPYNWITASGVTGLREARIRMFLQPGRNPSTVDAFDKHIGKIPTWSEGQIKGDFKEPRLYTVHLFFAETEGCEAGQRIFDVALQDKQVLQAFDIVKEAGGVNRTVVKEFKGISVKDDLKITLRPAAESQAEPLLCGIEIIAEGW